MMKKSNKKGFTLVELIVVIAIMAILAAVLVPTVTSKIKDANVSAAISDLNAVASSIQADLISLRSDSSSTTILEKQAANAEGEGVKTLKDTTIKFKINDDKVGANCTVTYAADTGEFTITHKKYPDDVTTAKVAADGTITNAAKKNN